MALKKIMYTINGVEKLCIIDPEEKLSTFLRRMGLTGTKVGCDAGQCGACTVLLEGKPVRSCVRKMKSVAEHSGIETIEGLGTASNLHPLQAAWILHGGVQCGFCTPGFIVSAKALLDVNASPTRQEVRDWFQKNHNVCRCTGYKPLVDAVMDAAAVMRGEKTMKDLEYVAPPKVYGTKQPRPYALSRVLGVADYGDDIAMKMPENTLHLAVVMPLCPHGKIKKIDFSSAEKMPGVVKVVTAADIKGDNNIGGPAFHARSQAGSSVRPVLCDKKIHRKGDVVALVAAKTRDQARAAAKAVVVDIEELPYATNFLEAVLPDAVPVHEESKNEIVRVPVFKGKDTRPIFEKAPHVVDGSFYSSREPHLVIEPLSMQAYVDADGVLCVHSKLQSLHTPIGPLSKALGLPPNKIRMIDNPGGGSFGLAMSADAPGLVGAAALALGVPVTLTMSYAEHQYFTGKRAPSYCNMRIAADEKGKLLAIEFDSGCDHGAYCETAGPLEDKFIRFPGYGLNVPNVRGLARAAFSNNSYGIAYRSFGSPQAFTSSDLLLDELAEQCGLDSWDFLKLNSAKPGDTTNNSYPYHVYPVSEMLEKIHPYYLESLEWKKQPASAPNKKRGIGIALGGYHVSMASDRCEVWLELNPDGTITDYNCWQELGQGTDSGSVLFTCKALEPLGIKPEQVKLVKDDTGVAPMHGASAGSRSHFVSGNAHIVAANMLMDAMRKKDGSFRTYDEMVAEKLPTLYKGVWSSMGLHVPNDPNTGVGDPMLDHNFHLSVCRVEVDTKTGNTDVIAFRAVADVGVIGNRLALLGQAYSGIEHSIGYATSEEYSDYDTKYETMIGCGTVQCNTMPDDCEFQFVETPRRDGPFGSGGASECFQSSPHAAVMNAIYSAIGVRFYECPITPDLIKKGLELKAQGKSLKPDKYFLGSDFDEALEEIKAHPVKVQQGHGSGH